MFDESFVCPRGMTTLWMRRARVESAEGGACQELEGTRSWMMGTDGSVDQTLGQCGVVFMNDDHPPSIAEDHYRPLTTAGRFHGLLVDIVLLNARCTAAADVVTNRSATLVVASITALTRRQNESQNRRRPRCLVARTRRTRVARTPLVHADTGH